MNELLHLKANIRLICNHLDVRQQMLLRGMLLHNRDEAGIAPNSSQAVHHNYLATQVEECAMQDDPFLAYELKISAEERARFL